MLELLLCSLLTIFPDFLFRRYVQGKRLGKEITFYSVWYELRWGITACLMLTIGLITVVFYYHPSTKTATFFFRTVPIVPETIGRVAEIHVGLSDEVAQGQPLFKLDDAKQRAAAETARRKIAEVDAGLVVARTDILEAEGKIQEARSAHQQALDELETKQELFRRNPGIVPRRDIEKLQVAVEGRQAAIAAATAAKEGAEALVSALAHPRRSGYPRCARRRVTARRLAACRRAGAGRGEGRRKDRRHRGSVLVDRLCGPGARDLLGGVAGVLVTFTIGGVTISLSTSVGTLLAGLLVGHLRTHYPLFGRIPDGAVALMTSLGLAAFVGLTGIHAGPVFLSALKDAGLGLLIGGAVVTLLPQLVGLAFGHFVLRMNPILLLGALAGAQTVTAAMAAVQERSGSPVAVLGYTPAYPIGNILLTTFGTIIVVLMAS